MFIDISLDRTFYAMKYSKNIKKLTLSKERYVEELYY
jgi:hypothetical protein